jgi:hypothetical protein
LCNFIVDKYIPTIWCIVGGAATISTKFPTLDIGFKSHFVAIWCYCFLSFVLCMPLTHAMTRMATDLNLHHSLMAWAMNEQQACNELDDLSEPELDFHTALSDVP